MKKKRVWLIVAVALVIGGVYFYTTKKGEKQDENVIKIGAILPLTGNLSIIGSPENEAISIFQKNNRNFKIIVEDFASESKNVLSSYNKLKHIEKVTVFYTSTSPSCNVLKPEVTREKLLLIGNTSQRGIADLDNSIFQIAPITEDEIELVSKSNILYQSAELLVPNNELGINMKNNFLEKNVSVKFNIQSFNVGEKDFRKFISKFNNQNKTIVFQGYPNDIPVFLKQLQEIKGMNIETVILPMSAVWLPLESYQDLPFNIIFPLPTVYKNLIEGKTIDFTPKLENLVYEYKNQFKKEINYDVLFVWQALEIIDVAIVRANNNKTDVKAELHSIWAEGSFDGLLGKIILNKNGDLYVPMSIMSFKAMK